MGTNLYAFLISSCVASGLMLKESYNLVSATIVVGQYLHLPCRGFPGTVI